MLHLSDHFSAQLLHELTGTDHPDDGAAKALADHLGYGVTDLEVHVVRPDDPTEDIAVFLFEDDAQAFRETYDDGAGDVETCPVVADRETVRKMLDQRNPVIESASGWSYRESQENGDQVSCQACGNPLDDDRPITNDSKGYAYHDGCLPEAEVAARKRLEYLRGQIRGECISYGEIAELQGLVEYIAPGDVELLEWAGVPEHPEGDA